MITQTALRSPRYLAAIKAATVQAIRTAHSRVTPAAAVWVENRRGDANLYVQACRGKSVEYRDNDGRDLTAVVLGALREWHEGLRVERAWKRATGRPLLLTDFPVALRVVRREFAPIGPSMAQLIKQGWLVPLGRQGAVNGGRSSRKSFRVEFRPC